jgi:hypothetical protein
MDCVHFIDTPARRAEVVPPENRRHDTARTYATLRVGCEAQLAGGPAAHRVTYRDDPLPGLGDAHRTGPIPYGIL